MQQQLLNFSTHPISYYHFTTHLLKPMLLHKNAQFIFQKQSPHVCSLSLSPKLLHNICIAAAVFLSNPNPMKTFPTSNKKKLVHFKLSLVIMRTNSQLGSNNAEFGYKQTNQHKRIFMQSFLSLSLPLMASLNCVQFSVLSTNFYFTKKTYTSSLSTEQSEYMQRYEFIIFPKPTDKTNNIYFFY